ncbi:MAG TPA: HD domain-containing phosphohydrolase [Usitatibacteraceae bacterium]|nr:HD domain-containing phosphohydrolase [Usitatibacteraceae bacterium]
METHHVIRFLNDAIDLVGVNDHGHDKRVGLIAHAFCVRLGLPRKVKERIFVAGLLHDCGVSSTYTHDHLVAEDQWGEVDRHCFRGSRLLASLDCLSHLATIVRFHHTPWDTTDFAAIPEDTRFAANLVFLADRLDAWLAPGVRAREHALAKAMAAMGTLFFEAFAPAIASIARDPVFWADIGRARVGQNVDRILSNIEFPPLSQKDLRTVPFLMAAIVDAKCPYTAEHSFRVAAIARRMGEVFALSGAECDDLETAGLLHDIGKLTIPDEIINKPGPLTENERQVMETHAAHSYDVILHLPSLERIAELARHHHERGDGRGYPDGIGGDALSLSARIISAADFFQALTQRRPYRPGMDPSQVREALDEARRAGRLDAGVLDSLETRFDEFWELSTGPLNISGLEPGLARLCQDPDSAPPPWTRSRSSSAETSREFALLDGPESNA